MNMPAKPLNLPRNYQRENSISETNSYLESIATKEDVARFEAKQKSDGAVGAALGFLFGVLAVKLWKNRKYHRGQ